jgi:hypothetical protein
MIYLSVQPAIPRYTWEVEVYIHNFIEMGIDPCNIQVVLGYDKTKLKLLDDWLKLKLYFKDVNFYFYEDTRKGSNSYQPSLQAHILEKHWIQNPWLENHSVFFHDADFLFTKPFDFTPFLRDKYWYFSDTISYIGGEYIRSKGERVLEKMCEVAEIDKQMVLDRQNHSGGAQKLIKGVTADYWKKVFDTSMKLWKEIPPLSSQIAKEKKEKGESYHVLQHWTMSMWAELWECWKMGKETRVPKEFDFMFATNRIEDWDKFAMYHSAGVLGNQSDTLFFKGKYTDKLPYDDELKEPNTQLAVYNYYKFLKEVGKKSVLL